MGFFARGCRELELRIMPLSCRYVNSRNSFKIDFVYMCFCFIPPSSGVAAFGLSNLEDQKSIRQLIRPCLPHGLHDSWKESQDRWRKDKLFLWLHDRAKSSMVLVYPTTA